MDLTCLLPCEILQHIAGSLLPRSQCRLALTSRQNYDCLYSPLLRWHAQKDAIQVPIHNVYYRKKTFGKKAITVLVIRPRVLIIEAKIGLHIGDLTNFRVTSSRVSQMRVDHVNEIMHTLYHNSVLMHYRRFRILDGYLKYLSKNILIMYINTQQPIFLLPDTSPITTYLSPGDMINLWIAGIIN